MIAALFAALVALVFALIGWMTDQTGVTFLAVIIAVLAICLIALDLNRPRGT